MRNESEMMDIIMSTAKADDRIRAVEMNGSRANPSAPVDCFQDYDICYYVNDIESFTKNHNWIDIFGKRLMLQMPELGRWPANDGGFNYLILFTDGNRIDLSLIPVEKYSSREYDSQSILLLDKDSFMKPFPPAGDSSYYIKPPIEHYYNCVCNNFWWCSQNVAKGIWRDELSYVMHMYGILRDELHYIIEKYIGMKTDFSVSAGKAGKYFKLYLNQRQYDMFCKTYTDSNYNNIWNALFIMCDLFRELAQEVAANLGYIYPQKDDENMTMYLKHVRTLPGDATQI